ncbi:tyrosine-type recombinase/integrase [archaeon]|jgi:integrase|nr:tyrosine-type recombinase/integrase [archaeon]MBT4417492.1 tyrosine-type recombinase/integrase [archaeon]
METHQLKLFEHYLKDFSREKSGKKLGKRTIHGVFTLAKHIPESFPGENVKELKLKYAAYLRKRGYPIARYALWLYLKSLGYEERDIKEIVSFERTTSTALTDQQKLAKSVLSKKELLYLVENIENLRDNLIIRMLYDTGARVSELTNLKLKDLDLSTREVFLLGKGNKPRTVFFQKTTAKILKKYLKSEQIASPNELIFKIKPITVWYNLKKLGKELISRDLRPHMLRHTRLQHMADQGVDSFLIKSYAGHSDIATTQIYVKASKYQGKMAFERAGDVWKNEKKK